MNERQVPAPDLNPRAQSHEALKGMTDAADPAGSQAVADAWGQLAAGLDEAADLFRQAMMESAEGWTGEAADGMREQLARVATWSKATAAQYKAASGAIGEQSAAADSAKSAMPPPVPYDPAQMIRDAAGSGSIADIAALSFTMYAQKQKHDAAHDQAAEIVTNRDQTFADAAGRVPAFSTPPSLTGDGGGATTEERGEFGGAPVVGGAPVRSRVQDSPPAPRRSSEAAVAERTPESRPASGPPAPPAVETPPPAVETPPPATQAAASAGEAPAPASAPSAIAATDPNSFVPGAGAPPAGVSAAGFGPAGGPLPLLVTPAAATGFGPGGFAVAPGRPVHTASAGMAGVPVSGRGEGDKDGEHKRPEYLIEPDAESMFGSDAMTSPPVIGEG